MDVQKKIIRPELEIDPAFLERLSRMGGEQLVVQLIEMYFQRSAELINLIHAGFSASDFDSTRAAAHSLISSSGNLGGQRVSYLSKLIEHYAMEENTSELVKLSEQLDLSQTAFLDSLKKHLEKR